MAVFSSIVTGLKLLGIGGGFIRDLRKDSLDYKLAASQTENEGERIELEHKAKVIDMQLEDIRNARTSAAGLPKPLIWCMTGAAAMAVLWFSACILRSLYGYAAVTELDEQILGLVKVIFSFLFSGAALVVAANRLKS